MRKTKTQKGITLVALIITIIVLLILAVVTISAVRDSGIIKYAEDAVKQNEEAQEKELISLAYSAYIMEKKMYGTGTFEVEGATISGNEEKGYEIVFSKSKNEYIVDKTGKVEKNENNLKWVAAWVCDGTSWGPKIINDGNTAEPQGQIVAKFYNTGKTISFNGITSNEYHLVIEGTGQMTSVADNAWRSELAEITDEESLKNVKMLFTTKVEIKEGITNIPQAAFSQPFINLKEVIMPESITEIENDAFSSCANLENVIIPSNVTKIHDSAFKGCSKLKSIIIPEKTTYINTQAFEGCTGLEELIILSNEISINHNSFRNCPALMKIKIYTAAGDFSIDTGYAFTEIGGTSENKSKIYVLTNGMEEKLYGFYDSSKTEVIVVKKDEMDAL